MRPKAPLLEQTRRFIPFYLVNYVMLPATYYLIYVGWGREVAADFRDAVMM